MTPVVAALDVQTLVDAIGQGAVYALMAVGIGLVFGVLRLVNFAYGQLVMAGAYALAFASAADWPVWAGIALCYVVVVALSLAMELLVFRPLRTQSPAVMLVTTFAVAFILQAVALVIDVRDGTIGQAATSIASLNRADHDRRRRCAQDHDRRDLVTLVTLGAAGTRSRPHEHRPPYARRRRRLPTARCWVFGPTS